MTPNILVSCTQYRVHITSARSSVLCGLRARLQFNPQLSKTFQF